MRWSGSIRSSRRPRSGSRGPRGLAEADALGRHPGRTGGLSRRRNLPPRFRRRDGSDQDPRSEQPRAAITPDELAIARCRSISDVGREDGRRVEVEAGAAEGVEPPCQHLGRLVGAQVFEFGAAVIRLFPLS